MAAARRAVSMRRCSVIAVPGEVLRYLSVGVLNTLVGLSVIWGLILLGAPPVPANLGGYVAGLMIAFFLNRAWTFRATARPRQALRYIAAFGLAYGINLAILTVGLALLDLHGFLAQLPALAGYTVSFFLLCKFFVFGPGRKRS